MRRPLFFLPPLAFLLFLVFRAPLIHDLDGGHFAMALRDYDLRFFQPHPPGDPLFVLLAKGFSAFAEPNLSLQLATQSVYLAFLVVLLAPCRGRRGWAAGLLVLSSPLFWKQSVVVSPDMSEALLFLLTAKRFRALSGWFAGRRGAFFLGLLFGLRPGALLFLGPPLFLHLVFHDRRRSFSHAGCFLAGAALWLVPQIVATGGPGAWLEAYARRFDLLRAGAQAVSTTRRAEDLLSGGVFALSGAGLLLLAPSGWRRAFCRWDGGVFLGTGLFMLFVLSDVASFWSGPAALFFFYLASEESPKTGEGGWWMLLAVGGLAFNLLALTLWVAPAIAQRQRIWQYLLVCVERHAPPEEGLVVTRFVQSPHEPLFFRHATVYFPTRRVWHLRRLDPPTWWLYEGGKRREIIAHTLPVPPEVSTVLLPEPTSIVPVRRIRCGTAEIGLLQGVRRVQAAALMPAGP